jgi:hypothetical protein
MVWMLLLLFVVTILVPAIVLFIVLVWVARRRFMRQADREMEPVLEQAYQQVLRAEEVILEADLAGLPEPVKRWLRYSGVVGRPRVFFARARQSGRFRQAADRPWLKAKVVQYTLLSPPTRMWIADMRLPGNLPIVGRDLYRNERGSMLIKPLGMFKLADAQAVEVDQGAAHVFLNDMMFIPQIALQDYIQWEALDDRHAKATFTDGEIRVSAEVTFGPDGEFENMEAMRYRMVDDRFQLDRWSTPVLEYQEIYGYHLPKRVDVIWHLEDGDLCYFEASLDEVEFNKPDLYT